MTLEITVDTLLFALLIFSLRVFNSAVGTVRLVVMARGQVMITVVLGFIEALIFAYVTASIVTDLTNILNLVAYCGGFSLGIYAGMVVERRFVVSYVRLNVITKEQGREIAKALRDQGHGVTEVDAVGSTGGVSMLNSVILRRDSGEALRAIYKVNPDAFVTLEEARSVQHGWMRHTLHHQR